MRLSSVEYRTRLLAIWRRVLNLSWPVMVEQVLRTLMRTTDIIVTGMFSPAAIAAVGLADAYARFPLRIGLGLGGGAIALSSQDTGSGAAANRNEAITQAVVIGALAGLPFVVFGVLFGDTAIAILGAPANVVQMSAAYLAIIFATSPARHVGIIAARALQGTGDTRTPMYVNIVSNGINIAGTVALGLGVGPFPDLAIVGVGLATAFGNVFTAVALTAAIASPMTRAAFTHPRDLTITKQLLAVSAPRIAEGLAATIAEFPFNALLLTFGTDVNAAYHVGQRIRQQITSPLSRGYHVAANIVVGQALGDGDTASARFNGWATAALGLLTVGTIGVVLFFEAERFARIFTDNPSTVGYATDFARVYGLTAPVLVLYVILSGALQGGSDTKTPFVARVTGMYGFMLGFSYLTGVVLGYGVVGVYAGVFLYYAWALLIVATGFHRGRWAAKTEAMMAARGSESASADGGDPES